MNIYRQILEFFLDILFPQNNVLKKLNTLSTDDLRICITKSEPISDNIYSILSYHHPLANSLIWEIKYRGNRNLARKAAELLYSELLEIISEMQLYSNFNSPVLVPIPISKARMRERGFNQSVMIAEELIKICGNDFLTLEKYSLIKTKDTMSQTKTKNRNERLKNLKDCFAVKNPETIKGKNIILLDDVTTTGATLSEAKKTLLKAGARKVIGVTLAH
jgi:competence protein ComFC